MAAAAAAAAADSSLFSIPAKINKNKSGFTEMALLLELHCNF